MTPAFPDDFAAHLARELAAKCASNPRYSLRAFARFLGIDASSLSKLLNRKKAVNPRLFLQIAGRLGLSPAELARYHPGKFRASMKLKISPATFLEVIRRCEEFGKALRGLSETDRSRERVYELRLSLLPENRKQGA